MTTARATARTAQNSSAFRGLARAGYVVLGVVHIVIGLLAVSVTAGAAAQTDQSGAMERIRATGPGVFVLWAIAGGLLALAVWQVAETFTAEQGDAKKRWGARVKYLGTAVAYLAIAGTAATTALGGSSDSAESSQTFSARMLASPGGVFVLVLIGLVVAAIGVAFVVRGVTKRFEKHLSLPSGSRRAGIVTLGLVGYAAKGIAVAVAGVLFVVAAVTHDPRAAGGLDAALHTLATLPWGMVILWLVGAGLVVYGVFCFARARYARL